MTALVAALFAAAFVRPMERVASMDPIQCRSIYDSHAIQLVYDTPLEVDYRARPYRLVAGYCELPTVSADGLRYVFRTVKGPAADMVRSLERLRDPKIVSPNGWVMKDVASVVATDANAVSITLKRRCHFFPWLMAYTPCSVMRADGDGTGDYFLAEWRKNHEMVFEKRKRERGRGFDTIRYLVIDDATTQWLMFLKGEIDYLGEISRDNWDTIVGRDGRLSPELERQGMRLHSISSLDMMYIGFNLRDRTLGPNRKLRQALNAAFDFPKWREFYNGRVLEANTVLPPGIDGRLEDAFPYRFDLANSKRLLAEAGYAGGTDPRTGRRLTLTLAIGRASQASREQGELLASFFERIGVKLELAFMTWDAFLKAVNDGRVQMFSMGWVGDYPDAQNFLQLFHSKNTSPGPNHFFYENAAYDAQYDAALAAETDAERNVHWRKCQELLREDCPIICTHYNKAYTLVRARVGNYVPSVFSYGAEKHYENLVP